MSIRALSDPAEPVLLGTGEAVYIGTGSEAAYAVLHRGSRRGGVAVLLVPPFGWEEVSSYRPRAFWAQSLAQSGRPALCLTLPSTGDAGGRVADPARVPAWTGAIGAAAQWLRQTTDATRVVAVGMQLGGMLVYQAAADGAPIDDLVLWATPARGRALIRRLRAFARLEAETFYQDLPQPPAPPEGELEAGGFRMTAETVAAVSSLDLLAAELPAAERRRVLLLGQDGTPPDQALGERLHSLGAEVTTGPGDGYGDMTSHPQTAGAAPATLDVVIDWLTVSERAAGGATAEASMAGQPVPPAGPPDGPGPVLAGPRLDDPDGRFSESPVSLTVDGITLPGVLTLPPDPGHRPLCAVLLDTGAVRRTGPSRLWVETARRWARQGIPTLRVDVEGVGDAPGPLVAYPDDSGFHRPQLLRQLRGVLDHLQREGTAERFLLAGLCSGAYWAFWTAIDDPRVAAVALVNQRVVIWDEDLVPARYVRRLLSERPSPARLRRVVTPARIMQVARWLLSAAAARIRRHRRAPAAGVPHTGSWTDAVARLAATDVKVTMVFAAREPYHDELVTAGLLDQLLGAGATLHRVPVSDHTLRPAFAQQLLAEALDGALADADGAAAQRSGG